jgi:hypothetical protein
MQSVLYTSFPSGSSLQLAVSILSVMSPRPTVHASVSFYPQASDVATRWDRPPWLTIRSSSIYDTEQPALAPSTSITRPVSTPKPRPIKFKAFTHILALLSCHCDGLLDRNPTRAAKPHFSARCACAVNAFAAVTARLDTAACEHASEW